VFLRLLVVFSFLIFLQIFKTLEKQIIAVRFKELCQNSGSSRSLFSGRILS
jgi:hypothetical protein